MRTVRRAALVMGLILIALIGGLWWTTYRQVRQIQLNHALIAAIQGDRTAEALALLDRGADANTRQPAGDPQPLWKIVLDTLRGIRQQDDASTALSLAVIGKDNVRLVDALLKHGADPNADGDYGSILVEATSVDDDRGQMVRQLVEHGAKINVMSLGHTPLSNAIERGNVEMMKLLVEHGADIEMPDETGLPPLHWAAYGPNQVNKVQFLLDHHANVNSRDSSGHTLLYSLYHDTINDQRIFTEVIKRIKRAGATQ